MRNTRRRTANSGMVFFDLTLLISQLRCSGVNLSTFYLARQACILRFLSPIHHHTSNFHFIFSPARRGTS
jgi:hypothetical protein